MDTSKLLTQYFSKYKLNSFNKVNVVYDINNAEDFNNILIGLKTLFNQDFKILKVNNQYDSSQCVMVIKKYKLNTKIINPGITNIFHTYEEDTGFISYEKYKHHIIDIISITDNINNNDDSSNNNLIITIEQDELIPICEAYNLDNTSHLEYIFELENNIIIRGEHHLESNKYRLVINIPIMEEKHINDEKLNYINNLYNHINIVINDN
jgi:hypothetical protein